MMKKITARLLSSAVLLSAAFMTASAAQTARKPVDLFNLRYKIDSSSVFHNRQAKENAEFNRKLDLSKGRQKAEEFQNPEPNVQLPAANKMGTIDGLNGELWYYTGQFRYDSIPPHDNVMYTELILREYKFTIYDSKMEEIGVIQDLMDYKSNEVRVPDCDITPFATRNFFNTDDKTEIVVAIAVNKAEYGNNYYSYVYQLDGEKDADGFDKPVMVMDDFIADVCEGPETDGSDNYYVSFMRDYYGDEDEYDSFWDYLLDQKAVITVYGKANAEKNEPREIFETTIPLIQFPGNQQDVPPMISFTRNGQVYYSVSYYKEPFYNEYEDFMSEMTMREGNSLVIDLYKANEHGLDKFSTTEIAMALDPMINQEGNPTCLFSFYSIGNLGWSNDILFDSPDASPEKPNFIISQGNYVISTDGEVYSFFTYNNDGSLRNTIAKYVDGTRPMSNIEGFEPQQMFVTTDAYGYVYNFVDLYSAKTVCQIPADYAIDDDSETDLLTANCDRVPVGDSYNYVYELRYPMVDDYENDIMRFMHIDAQGKYVRTDNVNMGKSVMYAQSYISQEALKAHAYTTSDTPAYMMLVKRGSQENGNIEQLMIAEIVTEEQPEGKTLLLLGPGENGILASIVPEFGEGDQTGRLFVYYRNNSDLFVADVYNLPLDADYSGVTEVGAEGITVDGSVISTEGEIKVYSLDGKAVFSGIGSVDFNSLESGIYIVKTAGKTFKVAK